VKNLEKKESRNEEEVLNKMKEILSEAGGKNILGVNALQVNASDILRVIKRWQPHISSQQGAKHHKITDNTGKTVTKMPKNIGPKGAIDTLTAIRNHLESRGLYQREKGEHAGLIGKRQNVEVSTPKTTETPQLSLQDRVKAKVQRYVDLTSRPSMSAAKRQRLFKAIEQLNKKHFNNP
jgi:hypothetical protein